MGALGLYLLETYLGPPLAFLNSDCLFCELCRGPYDESTFFSSYLGLFSDDILGFRLVSLLRG